MNTSDSTAHSTSGFREIGIVPAILNQLDRRGIVTPTPIQHAAIPQAASGADLIGIAQTGTGKTFAFGLPMLQRLADGSARRALVVLPTRELAYQVEEALAPFATPLGIRMAVFVGGASMNAQRSMLRKNPRILVATPGRLNDHLQQKTVTLHEVDILVLDEADRMLDMGFKPQIDRILQHVPSERQTLLFSATMPQDIVHIATAHMRMPVRVEVAPAGSTAERVTQELIIVRPHDKSELLLHLLREHEGQVLVFSRTKYGAKKITAALRQSGIAAAEIHANRSLAQRRGALSDFKRGTCRVLVATDIASRGIDVTGIALVINYDLPDDPADYVHRIGRTGRADREGHAISLATPVQASNVRAIEKLIRAPIPRRTHHAMPDAALDAGPASGPTVRRFRPRNTARRPRRRIGGR